MTLGERISALRNQHNMSQGDLAERMKVSRQSVSKWETDTSVPELDKLIQLSDVFHITLDDLVKGRTPEEQEAAEKADGFVFERTAPPVGTQTILGFLFLGIGLLCGVLSWIWDWALLVIGGYLILCGAICLLVKRRAGLWIGWVTLVLILCFLARLTGVPVLAVFRPAFYQQGIALPQILSIAFWIAAAGLLAATVRSFRKKK